jgi:hypothetical protein
MDSDESAFHDHDEYKIVERQFQAPMQHPKGFFQDL